MAKFQPILGNLRGSIGANCFAVNRYGAYVRFKQSPTQPNTQYQLNMRNLLMTLSKYWSTQLTEAQRVAWRAFAEQNPISDVFGQPQPLSGINAFIKLNTWKQLSKQGFIWDPPVEWWVYNINSAQLSISYAGTPPVLKIQVSFTYPEPAVPIEQGVFIYASSPITPGVTFYKTFMRFLKAYMPPMTTPLDITTDYLARFGQPPEGTKVFVIVAAYNPEPSCLGRGLLTYATVPSPSSGP
jgi:hypothetical protein